MEKKYDHQINETAAQQKWEQEQTYAMENNPGQLFSIDTPPPTVSGTLHIGHIFSYTQTDIIARYKRMNGFSVFYPFGFDDNGLPTERYVEKKRNVRGHELSRSEFIRLCTQESHEAAEIFKKLWQRMGLSADLTSTYSTISDEVRKISQESFIELFKKNYIYRTQEPALYCTTCRTSVAQAELDDKELPSSFNDILFKDSDGNNLIIATTRPELLPACTAILYNPNDKRYTHLKGKKATVPLFGHTVPILEDELVSIEKGSGLVMVCTFGDKTDIIWYKKHNLPYHQVIGLDGKCTDNAGFLEGLTVEAARAAIIEKLHHHNLIVREQALSHSVSVHERCKKAIEFVVLPQWFISILPHKQHFLDIAHNINWYPTFMKSRYDDWVKNLAWDWGISRQRFYGIPFPAWHCHNCDAVLLAHPDQLPIDPQEVAHNGPCTNCGSTDIRPDTDVMDTWNTSSLTPYICYNLLSKKNPFAQPNTELFNFMPMTMRPQAHDIIRTWAFDTIVKTWMHHNTVPWKDIVISGHVLSDKKEKLSKKEGNAMDPELLLQKYPADAIRYWTACGKLGHDMMFSEEQLIVGQKLITKLWNAFKFAEPHLAQFNLTLTQPASLDPVNKWLLHTVSACFEKYHYYFEQQEYGLALEKVEQFFWHDYCDNYIELIKNRLFNPEQYVTDEVNATCWTLYHVGLRILQLYAPYLPHITENIYQELYKKHENIASLHQTKYQLVQTTYRFESEATGMLHVIELTTAVRKLKTERQISLKTPLATLTIITPDAAARDILITHNQLIRGITQAITVSYKEENNHHNSLTEIDGSWHAHVVLKSE